MMRSKLIIALLLVALVAQFAPVPSAFAAGEILFETQVDAGYWDIWLYADGVTWQYTGQPGDNKSHEFDLSQPADAVNFADVRFEMTANVTESDFMQAGGWQGYSANTAGWKDFKTDYLKYIPDNYRKTGEKQVSFTLWPKNKAENIKKVEQAELVEGYRWYLPITVSWYGVPKNGLPDFQVVDLQADTDKTEPGNTYVGSVTYKLKDGIKEPTEAILHMTHNGYALSTSDSKLIDGQKLVFEPGEIKTFNFKWTGQASDSTLRAEIWPTEPSGQPKESRDTLPEDNVLEIEVPRAGYKLTMLKTGQGKTAPPEGPEGTHIYPANERVELSAIPDPSWKFLRWEGDVSGTNPKVQVVMNSDKKARAVFEKIGHILTIRVSPDMGGTTNPGPGVHTYTHGTNVNVRATANEYWTFSHWSANAEGANPNINVSIDRDKVIVAHFKQDLPEPAAPGNPGGMGDPILVR